MPPENLKRRNDMKKLTVAITVDNGMGLAFNKRRQSRDKKLIEDLISVTDKMIYVSNYSAPLFEDFKDRIAVVDSPINECQDDACCFLEMADIADKTDEIECIILYRWNRLYPSDTKLTLDLNNGFELVTTDDFVGSSHDRITREIYKK